MQKQTAVEWLIQRIENTSHDLHHLMKIRGEFEQAKAMEKEQHSDTWIDSMTYYFGEDWGSKGNFFEQYYNETYKTK